jgi:chemotaxis signal transduction protein
VDQVKEVIPLSEDNIEKVSKDVNDEKASYVSGVGKTDEGLVTLLNIKGFIING